MSRVRYTDFRSEFVRYLYRDSLESDMFIDFAELADENEIPFEPRYISAIFEDLLRPGYIEPKKILGMPSNHVGRLTGHGLEYIEGLYKDDLPAKNSSELVPGSKAPRELPKGRTFLAETGTAIPPDMLAPGDMLLEYDPDHPKEYERGSVPASDRIVLSTDNLDKAQAAIAAVEEVSKGLQAGNDVGDLTAEEVIIAQRELALIQQAIANESMRVDWIEAAAKATFSFIVRKAAGTAVGNLAWKALVAIGAWMGFSI